MSHTTYTLNETIINQISNQVNQILTNIQKYNEVINTIHFTEKNKTNNLEFTRSGNSIIKCNFCPKISYYQDTNNKYYCWFHRSQYE
jgi:hypothetical protein